MTLFICSTNIYYVSGTAGLEMNKTQSISSRNLLFIEGDKQLTNNYTNEYCSDTDYYEGNVYSLRLCNRGPNPNSPLGPQTSSIYLYYLFPICLVLSLLIMSVACSSPLSSRVLTNCQTCFIFMHPFTYRLEKRQSFSSKYPILDITYQKNDHG